MKKYQVLQPVELHSGKIRLTDEQAAPRLHNLQVVKGNVYEIKKPIWFKAGEIIGLESVSKEMQSKFGKPDADEKPGADE